MTKSRPIFNRVDRILSDRSSRVRELQGQGRKVVGYLCSYAPLEILTAVDLIPYRIFGDIQEPITEADRILPAAFCPFMRSCIDAVYKHKYDFLDAVVGVHSCDPQEKVCQLWKSTKSYDFFHYLDMPATTHDWGMEMFRKSLEGLQERCEIYTGKTITPQMLAGSIEAYNRQRALVRELYDLKKTRPPLISGAESLQVIMAVNSLPLEEGNQLLAEVIGGCKTGEKPQPKSKAKRLLLLGACFDHVSLINYIERLGAQVVMDENCTGARTYFNDVETTLEPLEALAQRYLKLSCARTFKESRVGEIRKDRGQDLKSRFGHLGDYIKQWEIDGVIIQLPRYCDPFGYEVPETKDYFDSLGLPNLYLEIDYTTGSLAPLATRVQTFLEILA